MRRHELSDARWELIADLTPALAGAAVVAGGITARW